MGDTLYTTTATAWGGREGRVASGDNRLGLELSVPKSMGGDDGPGTNPEQLFAAGYAACFHSALKAIARGRKVDVSDSAISVTISIVGSVAAGDLGLQARIEAELPGLPPDVGNELLAAAHEVCPYSAATRGNVPVELALVQS
ncbi:organic hydroperoxide resistance protein [Marinactinospora rubrisoli]|uniref:Organic hydroperoxide resistance protein n=1 Tax=Marinactinospora rubrisoli TaxID=2715399 RepID=A0ABW2KAJ7_9ACTN